MQPHQRISVFQQRRAKIDQAFEEGGITAEARRRLLEIAGKETGMNRLTSRGGEPVALPPRAGRGRFSRKA